ncbi:unnamed protein product [Paramecium sonneborni]|uniref:Uncharacterized protein n=1 Tax=Paramecium sonneborni TaxID=65129 RepID=A0A8S1NKJ0_9CILI|nr:unnamed protein product [Paramecium sonneborni]
MKKYNYPSIKSFICLFMVMDLQIQQDSDCLSYYKINESILLSLLKINSNGLWRYRSSQF